MRMVEEIVCKLRTTKSRSKRKLLDAAADLINELRDKNCFLRKENAYLRSQLEEIRYQSCSPVEPDEGTKMILDCVLEKGAIPPTRAHSADAGLDLYSRSMAIVEAGDSRYFDTGVHIAIPAGYVGMVKAKSGLNTKHGITCTGVIDAGYTGSIAVKLYNHGTDNLIVDPGMKIAQLVILPIITPDLRVVNGMQKTDRGDNGFGSTGAY